MKCYNEFAHIYDELIYGDVNYKVWGKVILDICSRYNLKRENYLDLACGTGNMTREISKEFKRTWAVDMSQEMLSEAEEKMRREKLKAKFICQDITELKLNNKFDLITCILDSTNYILSEEKLERYLASVYEHLKEEGIFIFDINSYYKLTKILGNNLYTYDNEEVVYIWENVLEDNIVDMYLTFFIKEKDSYKRFDERHQERAYKSSFIEKVVNKVGFQVLHKLDNYKDENIKDDTERIVYILSKNGREITYER